MSCACENQWRTTTKCCYRSFYLLTLLGTTSGIGNLSRNHGRALETGGDDGVALSVRLSKSSETGKMGATGGRQCLCHLVPKLRLGNAYPRSSASPRVPDDALYFQSVNLLGHLAATGMLRALMLPALGC